MALQWALVGNLVIACAYAAITVAIVVPVRRAGQLRTNRLAVATALIFFSCAVGHGFHAVMYWQGSYRDAGMPAAMTHDAGWSAWASATWDVFTAAVGVYYWTLRRGYGVLLGGTGALYVDPAEQHRRRDIEVRERVAEARAQAEAERDAQAAMLRAVISNSQSLIYVKDLRGRYLLANEALQEAFGVTEEELLGRTDDYLDVAQAPVWQANDRRAHAGAVHLEERAGPAGGVRSYESTKFPLFDAAGELYAICGVSLDVTELRTAAAEAVHARDEALAQSRLKSEFVATMSHEIRTPMNGVLGLASLLLATNLDVNQRRYAGGIHSAGTALLGVINDILDFSKIEAGKVVLDPDDFDLTAVIAETVALVGPAAQAKGLTVGTGLGPRLPATVRGDGGRLRQILLNLAGNAVKFTGTGQVTVRADLVAEPLLVRFEVTDTGIGIAAADAERMFEPFTQADASTTRTYGGTGLGLAISRQLTEAMGGRIGVESVPGRGSTFWCEIPFAVAAGPVAGPAPDPGGLRILLVGAGGDLGALEADLRRWQLGVTCADTADEAVAALADAAGHGRHHDVLLVDAEPGDVDTGELARRVAADSRIPAVHVIVLNDTAPAGGDTTGRTFLPKPVHRSQLYDLLAQSMAVGAPPASAGHATVLLVEDNDINQMVALGILSGLGYRADVAADGLVALEMTAAHDYDVILMDCRMPRMDGFTATARLRLRETAGGRRTPIVAMTASALVADRERCLAAGMDDYLTKPVIREELAAALLRWSGEGAAAAAVDGPAVDGPAVTAGPDPAVQAGGVDPAGQVRGATAGQVRGATAGQVRGATAGQAAGPDPTAQAGGAATAGPGGGAATAGRSGWVRQESGELVAARAVAAGDAIGRRLEELAGDHSGPERALVHRLVNSFLARAPQHLRAIGDAFAGGDAQTVEDQAHSLRGAAGNIGATAVTRVCETIEERARAGSMSDAMAADLRVLRDELDRVDQRLRAGALV